MFELSIALKYLVPRRKQLSVSLIALMSVIVISLVVWLVLIFLSVTEGIERNWLGKLTSLNAPLRITPTPHYYSSYYYLADGYSSSSQFTSKNIAQKAAANLSDPYCPEEDVGLPNGFPVPDRDNKGIVKDPVKQAYRILEGMRPKHSSFSFQDYEISGALMRLQLLRENKSSPHQDGQQSFLTQVSYLASIPDRSPSFDSMLLAPTEKDLNHLFYLASHTTELSREDAPSLHFAASSEKTNRRLKALLESTRIREVESSHPFFKLSYDLIAENTPFQAYPVYHGDQLIRIVLPQDKIDNKRPREGKLWRSKGALYFQEGKNEAMPLPAELPIFVDDAMRLAVDDVQYAQDVQRLRDIRLKVHAILQNVPLSGTISWEQLRISKAERISLPSNEEKEISVLLAKNYRDNGIMVGDRGYLSYNTATASSMQEQRLPIFVAGFYDPGILSVGNRCILVPPFVTQTINASSSTFNLDKTQANGILVWFNPVSDADAVKQEILSQFEQAGIAPYWKVTTYKEYDFAKDLLQQFQSDKYLFSLVAAIILIVACCNIISLLTLLVNDKKREIGILQSMGASAKSIALIFGACGAVMGVISGLLGAGAAVLTLKHIDSIVHLLSFLQGREAFNAAFFGQSLPNTLSTGAFGFVFCITPLLSLLAGLVPAVKACRLRPSEILRSE
jgi:lipoprotein-releasing system permease protein